MQAIKPSRKKMNKRTQPLDVFFTPKSVAVVGATETQNTVGRTLLWNLVTSPFGGTVYPVNPKRPSVLGVRAYKSITEIPEQVDLAVIITPPPTVPGIIRECGENGVHAAIVISAGFKEIGPEGAAIERRVLEEAQAGKVRVIGPNCLGVMAPLYGHERHLRHHHRAARLGGVHQPERRACAPRSWTGASRKWWASARSSPSARWWTWAGAT